METVVYIAYIVCIYSLMWCVLYAPCVVYFVYINIYCTVPFVVSVCLPAVVPTPAVPL